MPYKNREEHNKHQRKYQFQVRQRIKMSKEFSRTLKQILLFISVSYTARGIESIVDVPAEEIEEVQKSLIQALSREHQTRASDSSYDIRIIEYRDSLNRLILQNGRIRWLRSQSPDTSYDFWNSYDGLYSS